MGGRLHGRASGAEEVNLISRLASATIFCLLAISSLLSGCAVSIPKVDTSSKIVIRSGAEYLEFFDSRLAGEMVGRALSTNTEAALWFGDDAFSPTLPLALSTLLQQELAGASIGRVVLSEARIGVFRVLSSASADLYRTQPRLRAAAVGEAVIRSVMSEARAVADADPEQWTAEISFQIGGERFVAYKRRDRTSQPNRDIAIRELLTLCVNDIVAEYKTRHSGLRPSK